MSSEVAPDAGSPRQDDSFWSALFQEVGGT